MFRFPYGLYGLGICVGLLALLIVMVMRMGYSDTGEYDRARNLIYSNKGTYGTAGFMTKKELNSVTGDGIYDVKFLLYDENKNPIGEYSTDNEGFIYIDDLTVQGKGRLYIRELEAAPGYELDKEYSWVTIIRKLTPTAIPKLPKTGY